MEEVYVSIVGTELEDMFIGRDMVSIGDLFAKIIELRTDVHYLNEELKSCNTDEFDPSTDYGISDRDFI